MPHPANSSSMRRCLSVTTSPDATWSHRLKSWLSLPYTKFWFNKDCNFLAPPKTLLLPQSLQFAEGTRDKEVTKHSTRVIQLYRDRNQPQLISTILDQCRTLEFIRSIGEGQLGPSGVSARGECDSSSRSPRRSVTGISKETNDSFERPEQPTTNIHQRLASSSSKHLSHQSRQDLPRRHSGGFTCPSSLPRTAIL